MDTKFNIYRGFFPYILVVPCVCWKKISRSYIIWAYCVHKYQKSCFIKTQYPLLHVLDYMFKCRMKLQVPCDTGALLVMEPTPVEQYVFGASMY